MERELDRKTFIVIDKEGNEKECEVLFEFTSEITEKNYIAYTDHTRDELGNIQVFANTFDPEKESGVLGPITTDKEWLILEAAFDEIKNAVMAEQEKQKTYRILYLNEEMHIKYNSDDENLFCRIDSGNSIECFRIIYMHSADNQGNLNYIIYNDSDASALNFKNIYAAKICDDPNLLLPINDDYSKKIVENIVAALIDYTMESRGEEHEDN